MTEVEDRPRSTGHVRPRRLHDGDLVRHATWLNQFDEDVIDRALAAGSSAQVKSFLYGSFLTSSSIGRSAPPAVLVAKLAVAAVAILATLSGARADVAVAFAAAAWVVLVVLEARRPVETGAPGG